MFTGIELPSEDNSSTQDGLDLEADDYREFVSSRTVQ
jgi:hypothetical protein